MAGNFEFSGGAAESAASPTLSYDRVFEAREAQQTRYQQKLADARRAELERMQAQEQINVLLGKDSNAKIPADLLAKLNRHEESVVLSASELYTPAAHQQPNVPKNAGSFYNSYEGHVQHERSGIHDGTPVPVAPKPGEHLPVDPNFYRVTKYPDGVVGLTFNGCAVDTDGTGRDAKDRCWQGDTSVHRADGRGLDTYKDNFVALPPAVMRSMGAKYGDHVMVIVDDGTKEGKCVYGIVGDASPMSNMRKNVAEASVHLLNEAGFNHVDGNHGIDAKRFKVVVAPGSGNHKGDIARHPDEIKAALDKRTPGKTADV